MAQSPFKPAGLNCEGCQIRIEVEVILSFKSMSAGVGVAAGGRAKVWGVELRLKREVMFGHVMVWTWGGSGQLAPH